MRMLFALMMTLATQVGASTPDTLSQQQERGKQHYVEHCADCHLLTLRGSGHGPQLAGPEFRRAWATRHSSDLLQLIQATMPPTAVRGLDEAAYLDIVAYILRANGLDIGRDLHVVRSE